MYVTFGGPHEGAAIEQVINILKGLGELPVHTLRSVAEAASITQSLELGQALLRLNPDESSASWLHCLLCELLFSAGRFEESLAVADALLARPGPESVTRSAAVARVICAAALDPEEATGPGRATGSGDRSTDGVAAVAEAAVLADACFERGALQEGLRWARSAAAGAAEVPSPFWRLHLRLGLIDKMAEAGALAEAAALADGLLGPAAVRSHPSATLALSALEVRTLIHDGRWALARRDRQPAMVSTALASGEHLFGPVLLDLLSIAAVHAGDVGSARLWWAEADQLVKESGAGRPSVTHGWAELLLAEAEYGADAGYESLRRLQGPEGDRLAALFARTPGAAAWAVRVARARGDLALAERAGATAEEVAELNPGLPALAAAARHARSLLAFDSAGLAEAAHVQPSAWARSSAAADLAAVLSAGPGTVPAQRSEPVGPELVVPTAPTPPRPALEPVPPRGDSEAWARLSTRERQVAALVSRGMTNGQIASRISCSAHTVNFHLRNIFRKLGIGSRAEIAIYLPLSVCGNIS